MTATHSVRIDEWDIEPAVVLTADHASMHPGQKIACTIARRRTYRDETDNTYVDSWDFNGRVLTAKGAPSKSHSYTSLSFFKDALADVLASLGIDPNQDRGVV